jgi:hypothetical protein
MPKKPMRFGIKVWVAIDALSKYLWNFEVYCGKQENPINEVNILDTEEGHGMDCDEDST